MNLQAAQKKPPPRGDDFWKLAAERCEALNAEIDRPWEKAGAVI